MLPHSPRPAYHWDISDWVPSSKLSPFQDLPGYEARLGGGAAGAATCPADAAQELESDYYLGGYDIDNDCPPSHVEEFLSEDPLPPLPTDEDLPELYMPITSVSSHSTLSSGSTRAQRAGRGPSPNLSPPQVPPEDTSPAALGSSKTGTAAGSVDIHSCVSAPENLGASAGRPPPSDVSTCCRLTGNLDDLCEGVTYITDSEQQTKV